MASKGLRAISYPVIQKLKRAKTFRIPLKPLMAILYVSNCTLLFIPKFAYSIA
jgi:hypothetical protein